MKKNLSITLIFDYNLVVNTLSFLEIGQNMAYLDQERSKEQFGVAYQTFLKKELDDLIKLTGELKTPISAFFSGTFLSLLSNEDPEIITQLKAVSHQHLELLTGSYHNTLSAAFSIKNYIEEIDLHKTLLKKLFDTEPDKLYISENIYYNELVNALQKEGISCTFAGAIDWYLEGKTNNRILHAQSSAKFNVLLIDTNWGQEVFTNTDQTVHFLQLDAAALKHLNGIKSTVSKAKTKANLSSLSDQVKLTKSEKSYSIKSPVMGSLHELSLESIYSNPLQSRAIKHYYSLKKLALKNNQPELTEIWRQLGHSQYFFQMDRSHDEQAYDSYSNYMNILTDLEIRLSSKNI